MKPATLTPEAQAYYRLNQTLGIEASRANGITYALSVSGSTVVHIKIDGLGDTFMASRKPVYYFLKSTGLI